MEPWGWIVVYLIGFTLVQLLLFRYVGDGRSFDGMSLGSGEASAPRSVETNHTPADRGRTQGNDDTDTDTDTGDGVRCPHCGTHNAEDGTYTYCRECLGQLR